MSAKDSVRSLARSLRRSVAASLLVVMTACHKTPPPALPSSTVPETPASEIESVVLLVGDMGDAVWDRSPLPHELSTQVERWSRALHRDSSVAVIFLGDNVYPEGMRTEPAYFATDSSHLQTQVDILAGPSARANHSFGLFIAGNHDWGQMTEARGEQRLRNQEEFLDRWRKRGVSVQLLPKAGTPGPGAVNVGRHLHFILIDTAWWLLSANKQEKQRTMGRLQQHLAEAKAEGRDVVMVAHHPFKSASTHGGLVSFWKGLGINWLLKKTGAALQDLNSLPYRDLLIQLTAAFRTSGRPLIFVGGHDHTLQVLRAVQNQEPQFMLVSGAGSKSSEVSHKEGMLFRSSDTGYMRMVVKKDGGIDLFVVSTPHTYMICAPGDAQAQQKCVSEGAAKFETRFSMRLK